MVTAFKFELTCFEHCWHTANAWLSVLDLSELQRSVVSKNPSRVLEILREYLLDVDPSLQIIWKCKPLVLGLPTNLSPIEVTARCKDELFLEDSFFGHEVVELVKSLLNSWHILTHDSLV